MPTWLISSGLKTRESLGATTGRVAAAQQATVVVLDMAAIIHMVRPTRAKTFSEYVTFQIVPFLESQVTNDTQRMDAVWDSYPPEDNLKAHAQQRRGNGPRTRVGDGSTPIPKSEWNSGFLKNEDNKNLLKCDCFTHFGSFFLETSRRFDLSSRSLGHVTQASR